VDKNVHSNPFSSTNASFEKGERLKIIHGRVSDGMLCNDLDDILLGHLFDNLERVA